MTTPLLTIVLGAGKGTRMKSDLPKVLHAIGGRSMLGHVLATARAAGSSQLAVVAGPDMANVAAEAEKRSPGAAVFVQKEQLGTANAVLAAADAIQAHRGDVLSMAGDTPLITVETISRLRAALDGGAAVVVLGFHAADPTGYGRLLTTADGSLLAIREHAEATEAERRTTLCNSGLMAFRVPDLVGLLSRITPSAKGEFYLTDAVELACRDGLRVTAVVGDETEMLGINTRAQLAEAEGVFQRRVRAAAMANGATLIDPSAVWFSHDTKLGRDVIVEPNVFFGPGVTIADGAEIKANSYIEGATIGAGARIGPFARLRPGARLGAQVHIGNFVEVKNATIEDGAKANHLTYIGDARVGAKSNIGAGTIFCNYDGYGKYHTDIGAGVFIGSNTALVAPITIGDGAMTGAGSVITKNIPADAFALERSPQDTRDGGASRFRALAMKRKAASKNQK